MIVRLIFFFSIWITFSAFAQLGNNLSQNPYYLVAQNNKNRSFVVILNENKKWSASYFTQERGDFQQLQKREFFDSLSLAKTWAKQLNKNVRLVDELPKWKITIDHNKRRSKEIWKVSNMWSKEWEQKYSQWISLEVDEQFFMRHGIETDCADVAIGLRWIFARNNHLPAANILSGTSDLFSQNRAPRRWRKLKRNSLWFKDELFIKALNFVMESTSSWSLQKDSFPVSLDREGITPGTYVITNKNDSWHTRVFSKADFGNNINIPLLTYASTTPRDLRVLITEAFLEEGWPTRGSLEVMAHRWPIKRGRKWVLTPAAAHKRYSNAQFDGDGLDLDKVFYKSLFDRIKPKYSIGGFLDNAVKEIKDYILQRKIVVDNGFEFCQNNDCSKGTQNWDSFSTPERDRKLLEKFNKYEKIFSVYQAENGVVYRKWLNLLKNNFVTILGRRLSLNDVLFIFSNRFISSDPKMNRKDRWGMNYKNYFSRLKKNVSDLLAKRSAIINETDCSQNCRTDSGNWWDYNTYKIDRVLIGLASKYKDFCEHYDSDQSCIEQQNNIMAAYVKVGSKDITLSAALNRTLFFNSDPRAEDEWKWGIHSDLMMRVLPKYESITISDGDVALLDGKNLYDLATEKYIFKYPQTIQILLHKSGIALCAVKEGETISLYILKNKQWTKVKTIEALQFKSLKFSQSETHFFVFTKAHNSSLISVDLSKFSVSTLWYGDGKADVEFFKTSMIVWDKDFGRLFSYENLQKINKINSKFKNLITVENIFGHQAIGQFSDIDSDVYSPILFNFRKQSFTLLSAKRSHLELFDASTSSIVFSEKFDSEYPQVVYATIEQDQIENPIELSNFITDFYNLDGQYYLMIAKGGRWDDSLMDSQYVFSFGKDGTNILELDERGTIHAISEENYFVSDESKYGIVSGRESYLLPTMINFSFSQSNFASSALNTIPIWRFDSGHGDLEGIGGISLNSRHLDLYNEVIPTLTLNNNYRDLREAQLQNRVEDFKKNIVFSGTLLQISSNLSIWVK